MPVQFSLIESDAKLILEALSGLEKRWATICASSKNENEIAEHGNDLIELRLLIQSTEEKAVHSFGNSVLNFDGNPI